MDFTLLGNGLQCTYSKGFVTLNDEDRIIAKLKKAIYFDAAEANIKLINQLFNQTRPIADDSIEVMRLLVSATEKMFEYIKD